MRFLYTLSVQLYAFLISLAAFFGKEKAKQWRAGRNNWQDQLRKKIDPNRELVWFHVASLGEFEQARPLIEKVKELQPKYFVLLTFFSPSGLEPKKDYPKADAICYMPIDNRKNALSFLAIANPKVVVFVKYEFWFNFLNELRKKEIQSILICGIFRKSQHFFSAYGKWFSDHLIAFNHFYLQNQESAKLLKNIGFENTSVVGDTRIDRVVEISEEIFEDDRLKSFSENQNVIVFGSSWEKEEEFAQQLMKSDLDLKIIIAPHEVHEEKIDRLKSRFDFKVKCWTDLSSDSSLKDTKVLIINKIGLLSKIYRYGDFAFIGGGYGSGIHNTLEAAVYGMPVFFGPNFSKFQEAKDLIEEEVGFSFDSYENFEGKLRMLLYQKTEYKKACVAAAAYIENQKGATDIIYQQQFAI